MVPLAFSPYSEGIVQYAVNLAKALNVEKMLFINESQIYKKYYFCKRLINFFRSTS